MWLINSDLKFDTIQKHFSMMVSNVWIITIITFNLFRLALQNTTNCNPNYAVHLLKQVTLHSIMLVHGETWSFNASYGPSCKCIQIRKQSNVGLIPECRQMPMTLFISHRSMQTLPRKQFLPSKQFEDYHPS